MSRTTRPRGAAIRNWQILVGARRWIRWTSLCIFTLIAVIRWLIIVITYKNAAPIVIVSLSKVLCAKTLMARSVDLEMLTTIQFVILNANDLAFPM